MSKKVVITERWLRDRRLILKKTDREDCNIVYIYDVLPLHIIDNSFWFKWIVNGVESKTHIKYVSSLTSLYKALTHQELPLVKYKKGVPVYEDSK